MHFNKFTAFFRCLRCGHTNFNRFNSTPSESSMILIRNFKIPYAISESMVKKHNLYNLKEDQVSELVSTLKSLGYSEEEILDNCSILRRTPKVVYEHYLVLREAGFSDLSMLSLSLFRKLINKKISSLKSMRCIPSYVNVPETFLMHLYPKPVDFSPGDFTDEDTLGQVHAGIVKHYLQWRLESTSDEIETLFRVYSKYIKYKSLERLCENIEIALKLDFAPRKLLSFGYLLFNDPNIPKTILKEIPYLAGVDMRVAMRRYPKLLTIPLKNYKEVYKILKKEKIPDIAIAKHMIIFALAPSTIQTRFNEINDIPEMNIFRHHPRILKLIVHHNRARSRLSFIHQLQLKCTSMNLLDNCDDNCFERQVRNTKDTNNINDVLRLLKFLLKSKTDELEFNLRKHPHHLKIPLVNIEKTCKHIQKVFSNSAIVKVAPIVLYPSEKIDSALKQIPALSDLPAVRLTEAKKLNLALYLIERDHHFTGDGVWEESPEIHWNEE